MQGNKKKKINKNNPRLHCYEAHVDGHVKKQHANRVGKQNTNHAAHHTKK